MELLELLRRRLTALAFAVVALFGAAACDGGLTGEDTLEPAVEPGDEEEEENGEEEEENGEEEEENGEEEEEDLIDSPLEDDEG